MSIAEDECRDVPMSINMERVLNSFKRMPIADRLPLRAAIPARWIAQREC
jgi:hypothetical protein